MGAKIDGTGNECASNFYIMSQNFAVPNRTSQTNPWTFSTCSGPEIRTHL